MANETGTSQKNLVHDWGCWAIFVSGQGLTAIRKWMTPADLARSMA